MADIKFTIPGFEEAYQQYVKDGGTESRLWYSGVPLETLYLQGFEESAKMKRLAQVELSIQEHMNSDAPWWARHSRESAVKEVAKGQAGQFWFPLEYEETYDEIIKIFEKRYNYPKVHPDIKVRFHNYIIDAKKMKNAKPPEIPERYR